MEIGLAEAALRLGRSPEVVAKKAVVVSTSNQARNALRAKLLPGRKVGTIWLFQPKHVADFGKIKRPPGRPKEA